MSGPRPLNEADGQRLRAAAERFLATGSLDRSVPLRRLFDFLLTCTLAGRMPREIDVAQDVFGRTSSFDMGQDATIRVHVHRLRRKLEEFRNANPEEPAPLTIPRGEYRLVLGEATVGEVEEPEPEPTVVAHSRVPKAWLLALIALLVAINVAGWFLVARRDHRPATIQSLEKTPFWSTLARSAAPTVIVVGDYYIAGESQNGIEINRLVREFAINSRDDLDEYLMFHPDQIGRLVDINLHYLPTGAAPALRSLLPVIDGLVEHGRTRIITTSQLTPEILKGSNVIYVGYLSGLGLLKEMVFRASSLKVGESYDELIDAKTGKRFASDWSEVASGRMPHRDYGYLANAALPGGKQLLVIAGTRDAALMQSAESAADPKQLGEMARRTQNAPSTEGVIEVTTMGDAALAGKLVLARPLANASGRTALPSTFPDEMRIQ